MTFLRHFFKHRGGATALEYGIIAALLSILIVAGASSIGRSMNARYQVISNSVT